MIPLPHETAGAQEITLHRILDTGIPTDLDSAQPQPLPGGEVEWRDEAWSDAGAFRFRLEAPQPEQLAVLRIRAIPGREGALELRVLLFTRLNPLDARYFTTSEHIEGGERRRLLRHRIVDGIESELSGKPGRVVRIVVQDDHQSELRVRREGDALVVAMVPPSEGGSPTGGARPWYEGKPLTFLDYNLLAGGWVEESPADIGFGNNALGELWLFDFLAATFNGYFSPDGEDTLYLARLVARRQPFRGERFSLWVEGGGAIWERRRNGEPTENVPTATWTFGTTLQYRSGDWGALAHLATVNGPLAMQIAGGRQIFRPVGLFLAWHGFDGDTAIAAGLGVDF